MSDREAIDTFRRIFKDSVQHDIDEAIKGKANYLAALGIFSYIEFLGGLLTGKAGIRGESEPNFQEAVKQFPPEYKKLDQRLRVVDAEGKPHQGLYGILRCGLVHEYMIKGGGIIYNKPDGPIADHTGIWFEQLPNGRTGICLFNNEFFRDFRTTIDQISEQLGKREQPLLDNVKQGFQRLGSRTLLEIRD